VATFEDIVLGDFVVAKDTATAGLNAWVNHWHGADQFFKLRASKASFVRFVCRSMVAGLTVGIHVGKIRWKDLIVVGSDSSAALESSCVAVLLRCSS